MSFEKPSLFLETLQRRMITSTTVHLIFESTWPVGVIQIDISEGYLLYTQFDLTAFEIYSPHWHSLASSKIRYSVTFFFLVSLVNQDMNEYVIVKELQGKRVPDLLKCPEVNMLSFIHIQLKGS